MTQAPQIRRPWLNTTRSAAPAIVYAFEPTPPYRITFVADAVQRQMGYTPAECLAEPGFWSARVHPDDWPSLDARRTSLLDADHHTFEYRFRHKDGTYRWIQDELRVVRDGGGLPVEVVGVWVDVTPRREAEDALRESQERYHALFDEDLAGIFLSSADGRLLACNTAYARIFRFDSVDAALASDLEGLYHSPHERYDLLRLVNARKRLDSYRARLRRSDGTAVQVIANLVGLFDAAGRLTGLKGYVFDDSARAAAEEELRLTERRYLDLFEHANDVVFTTDLGLRFTSVNAAGERLTGYTRAETLAKTVDDLLPADTKGRIHRAVGELLNGKGASVLEVEIVAKDGRRVPFEVSTRLMTHEGVATGFQAIARDVSERRSLEAQVVQAQKMEAVGRLAGGIAHDFNNLLTVISGYAELLANECAACQPRAGDIRQIWEAANRAADLTRQLLAFSRRQILSPKVIDLNSIIGGLHKMFGRLIGEDIELHLALAPGLPTVKADPGQIEQVLMNLVVNARDAMPRGGRLTVETASVTLDESYVASHPGTRQGKFVVLAVSDNGAGMDPITQARIFEPFFTTKEEGKGTGLGLSTVYGIVKQSGGNVWVYSEPGIGTTFKVYLPESDVEMTAHVQHPTAQGTTAGNETILLVEDDEAVRQYATRILTGSGYRVMAAPTPREAEQLVSDGRMGIDLLVTDVVMPGSDGRTLAQSLCARYDRLKVLYMSGYTSEAIVDHGVLDASVNFIGKPFNAADLRAKVREALDR